MRSMLALLEKKSVQAGHAPGYAAMAGAVYLVSLASTAQMVRASLLATAATTTLKGRR